IRSSTSAGRIEAEQGAEQRGGRQYSRWMYRRKRAWVTHGRVLPFKKDMDDLWPCGPRAATSVARRDTCVETTSALDMDRSHALYTTSPRSCHRSDTCCIEDWHGWHWALRWR